MDSSDEEDVHQCGRCKEVFRSIDEYFIHKKSKICKKGKENGDNHENEPSQNLSVIATLGDNYDDGSNVNFNVVNTQDNNNDDGNNDDFNVVNTQDDDNDDDNDDGNNDDGSNNFNVVNTQEDDNNDAATSQESEVKITETEAEALSHSPPKIRNKKWRRIERAFLDDDDSSQDGSAEYQKTEEIAESSTFPDDGNPDDSKNESIDEEMQENETSLLETSMESSPEIVRKNKRKTHPKKLPLSELDTNDENEEDDENDDDYIPLAPSIVKRKRGRPKKGEEVYHRPKPPKKKKVPTATLR